MKIKKWIIALIICILLLSIILIIYNVTRKIKSKYEGDPPIEIPLIEPESKLKRVTSINDYYIVKQCLNKFYVFYGESFDEEFIENKKLNSTRLYQLLNEEYTEKNGITEENILSKLGKMDKSVFNINNMYVCEKTKNISIYIVDGILREIKTGKLTDFKIMVELDTANRTFSLWLEDFMEDNIKIGETIEMDVPENIQKKEYNLYEYENITEESYALDLFAKYKEEILYNSEIAYQNLDKDYREKKFGTLEDFQLYRKGNLKNIVISKLDKYQKYKNDNELQYVLIDQNGNYYIFYEEAVMKYRLVLDTYTVDLPQFVEKYKKANAEKKVYLNIQRIFSAIDSGDYKYVYNKLDDRFKQNYFNSLEEFENYIKENLFIKNSIGFEYYEQENDMHMCVVTIKDGTGKSSDVLSKKIIMELKEETDFVMSFDVEKHTN